MSIMIDRDFSFRKTKDEAGNEIPAPAPLKLKMNWLTTGDAVELVTKEYVNEDGSPDNDTKTKVFDLLEDCINAPALAKIKDLFDTMGIEEVRKNGIDPELYDFIKIALTPKAARGPAAIEEEVWNEFAEDYVATMVANGIDAKRAKVGAEILKKKLNPVKSNKEVLDQFKDRIDTWYSHSSKAEGLAPVYQFLITRVNNFIQANQPQDQVLASF